MGAEHDHGTGGHAGHSHGAGASTKRLAIALGLTTAFLIAELVGAFVFDSLALLSDAAHMFTDSAALAIALAAVKVGQRPPDDQALGDDGDPPDNDQALGDDDQVLGNDGDLPNNGNLPNDGDLPDNDQTLGNDDNLVLNDDDDLPDDGGAN